VDAVFTWVDTTDPEWLEEKSRHETTKQNFLQAGQSRFNQQLRPWDEISLSVASVRKHLRWIRQIYIVVQSERQRQILAPHVQNTQIVLHKDIMDLGAQPTFNSEAIEAHIHNIPGLAQHFIYFNDDTYVNKAMKATDFFACGQPIFRLNKTQTLVQNLLPNAVKFWNWGGIIANSKEYNLQLLNYSHLMYIHHPVPLTKTLICDTIAQFPHEWNKVAHTKFRSFDTITPLSLYLNWGLLIGEVVHICHDNIKTYYSEEDLDFSPQHSLVCINSLQPQDFEKLRQKILD
tara:strand:- start:8676 stop:9542 length:867 start_codon:yes stop_codon:yes gene_type:complete